MADAGPHPLPSCVTAAAALFAAAVAAPSAAQVAQTPVDGVDLYQTRVKPILEARCLKCHGANPERVRSGLSMLSRADLLAGGERGPAIDTKNPARSRLLTAISYRDEQLEMPPAGRLPDEEIEAITQWVMVGAPFGGAEDTLESAPEREDVFTITDADRAWWSLQPLARPAPPSVRDRSWPINDVDRFILARLEAERLAPAPDADRRALIRRATYDLTGLPPTAEPRSRPFVDDPAPTMPTSGWSIDSSTPPSTA